MGKMVIRPCLRGIARYLGIGMSQAKEINDILNCYVISNLLCVNECRPSTFLIVRGTKIKRLPTNRMKHLVFIGYIQRKENMENTTLYGNVYQTVISHMKNRIVATEM